MVFMWVIGVYTTIKVKKKNPLRGYHCVVAELSARLRRRVTYDEAINYLINIHNSRKPARRLDRATLKLIEMIRKSFPGAGPEDLKEFRH